MDTSTTDGPAEGVQFLPDAATLLADEAPSVPDSGIPEAADTETRDAAGASDEPGDDTTASSDVGDAHDAPPADTDPAPTYDPFRFTVDGKDVTIPGSYETEDGLIVIPRAEWDAKFARQFVADRSAFNQRETALRAKVEVLEAQRNAPNADVQRTKALEAKLMALVSDPEKLIEFADNFERMKPELLAQIEREQTQAERDYWKQLAENGGKPPATEPAPVADDVQVAQLAESFEPGLRAALGSVAKELGDAAQGADLDAVFGLAWAQADYVFFEAPEDLPQFGLKAGQIGVNLELLERLVQYDAAARRTAAVSGKKAASVEAENTRTLEAARRRPTPAARGTSPAATGTQTMSKSEWARKFRAGELDD